MIHWFVLTIVAWSRYSITKKGEESRIEKNNASCCSRVGDEETIADIVSSKFSAVKFISYLGKARNKVEK